MAKKDKKAKSGEEDEFEEEGKETVVTDMSQMKEVVFVINKGVVVMKYVKPGIQDNNYIEILEGISLDDEIIVAPYSAISKKLEAGMKVEIVAKEKLFAGEE